MEDTRNDLPAGSKFKDTSTLKKSVILFLFFFFYKSQRKYYYKKRLFLKSYKLPNYYRRKISLFSQPQQLFFVDTAEIIILKF